MAEHTIRTEFGELNKLLGKVEPFTITENFPIDFQNVGRSFRKEWDKFDLFFFIKNKNAETWSERECGEYISKREGSLAVIVDEIIKKYLDGVDQLVYKMKLNPNLDAFKVLLARSKLPNNFYPILKNKSEIFNGENAIAYVCQNPSFEPKEYKISDYVVDEKTISDQSTFFPGLTITPRGSYKEIDNSSLHFITDKPLNSKKKQKANNIVEILWSFNSLYGNTSGIVTSSKKGRTFFKNLFLNISDPSNYVIFEDFLPRFETVYKINKIKTKFPFNKQTLLESPIVPGEYVKVVHSWDSYNAKLPKMGDKLFIDYDAFFGINGINELTLNNKKNTSNFK